MNVEKYIKSEAKASLKGNWLKAITALFTSVLVFLAVLLVIVSAFEIMGDYDDFASAASAEPVRLVFFVLFHLLAVAGLILLSPVFAGGARVTASVAKDNTSDIGDVFHYFSSGDLYKDCVKFMTRIIVSFVVVLILFELPCLGGFILFKDESYADVIVSLLGLLGFCGAFLFSLRNMFAIYFYTEGAASSESFGKGAAVARGNVGKLVKLTFSYIGWLISLFLIIPFIYVIPYMQCAYFISVKYLAEQYDKAHAVSSQPLGTGGFQEYAESPELKPAFSNPNYTSAQHAEPLTLDESDTDDRSSGISLEKGGAVGGDL